MTTITVYTQPSCQPCKATKRWLDKRGITFTEVDVTTSPGRRRSDQGPRIQRSTRRHRLNRRPRN